MAGAGSRTSGFIFPTFLDLDRLELLFGDERNILAGKEFILAPRSLLDRLSEAPFFRGRNSGVLTRPLRRVQYVKMTQKVRGT